MKLNKIEKEFFYFSQKASETNQRLAIAGIALIWLFKISKDDNIQFSYLLFFALSLFVISLILDIIHNSLLSIIYGCHYTKERDKLKRNNVFKNKNIDDEEEVDAPSCGNLIGWVLFCLKIMFSVFGYILFFIDVTYKIEIL